MARASLAWWPVAWTAFLACLGLLALAVVWTDRAHAATVAASRTRANAALNANAILLGQRNVPQLATREDVSATLKATRPLRVISHVPGQDIVRWADTANAVDVDMIFRNDKFLEIVRRQYAVPPPPQITPFRRVLTPLCGLAIGLAVMGWWLWVVLIVIEPRSRWALAHAAVMLWVASPAATAFAIGGKDRGLTQILIAALSAPGLFVPLYALRIDRRERAKRDVCRACGYSLTGNASGVCPECGTRTHRAHFVAEQERVARAVEALERGRPLNR